jgi:hypothetical protein
VTDRRVGFGQMVRAGARAVQRYTGTLLALFVVQALIALGATSVMALIFAERFADWPRFDEGVDGDVAALIEALRGARATVQAIGWVGLGTIVLWAMVSWFLAGGLIAVLGERPQGRRDTARCFGAGGASSFLVLARLAAWSAAGHVVVLVVAMLGLDAVYPRIEHALTLREVVVALIAGLSPAMVLMAVLWTIVDHARVELVLRRGPHDQLGATAAFGRAAVFVVHRPIALAHVLAWGAAFVIITVVFAWLAAGHPMRGAWGAIALLVVRQGVALLRMALKMALVAGQVALGETRPPPPRRAIA